jgi:acetylglutamate synthase
VDRLDTFLEESFQRKLKNHSYIERISNFYIEENYRGAALLIDHPAGMYLSKFAIGTQARGEGLANELWNEMVKNHSAIFWRARNDNAINQWYERHVEGYHKGKKWKIFWRGIQWENIPDIILFSLSKEDDFYE